MIIRLLAKGDYERVPILVNVNEIEYVVPDGDMSVIRTKNGLIKVYETVDQIQKRIDRRSTDG